MRSVLLFLLVSAAPLAAQDGTDSLFHKANDAYREGRYEDAIVGYEEIRSAGFESGALFYNLGTAYFKAEDLGRSVANLHRALRFSPRDEDLRTNLSLALERTQDRAIVPTRFPLLAAVENLAGFLTWREWLVLAEILYAGTIVLLALLLLRPGARQRIRGPLQISLFLLVAVGLLFARAFYDQRIVQKGVVLADEISARSGPGERFTEEFLLHDGTVLKIHREAEGWILTSVSADLKGWIPARAVERI